MKRLSLLTLVFAVAFTFFLIGPVFLNKPFSLYPLMKNADVFDIVTPLVLIPLYWLLFWNVSNEAPGLKGTIIFLIFAAFCVEGHGMHLGANSIGHWLNGIEGTDIYNVDYFYDEVLGHYLWHFGIIGLSALLISQEWRNLYILEYASSWLTSLAGVIHGFTFFLIAVEGQTTPMSVPFPILITLFVLLFGRSKMRRQPLIRFFFVSYLIATLCFAGWGIYWGGFPEFSKVGIID